MSGSKQWAVGIDLGGTKIEAALVNEDGEIEHRQRVKTDVGDGPSFIQNQIVELVNKVSENKEGTPVGMGIGVAGQIEKKTGKVIYAPNLKWKNLPLKANLESRLQMPVVVLNDVRAAAWGEWIHGSGKGSEDMVCVFVGTGIGGGIVSGGQMLSGHNNSAGELGHMTVLSGGPECHCGNRGCLEALAGGWAIARRAKEKFVMNAHDDFLILNKTKIKVDDITARIVSEALHEGNPLAKEIFDEVTSDFAAGLIGIVNTFNPEYLVLGGGVIEGNPEMIEQVKSIIQEKVLITARSGLKVVPAELHNDSGVIGAASVVIQWHGKQ